MSTIDFIATNPAFSSLFDDEGLNAPNSEKQTKSWPKGDFMRLAGCMKDCDLEALAKDDPYIQHYVKKYNLQ